MAIKMKWALGSLSNLITFRFFDVIKLKLNHIAHTQVFLSSDTVQLLLC